MSLWTPSGEHPVDEGRGAQPGTPTPGDADTAPPPPGARQSGDDDVDGLRRQLADAPADVVVANHCYGLFELAAVYLSKSPPRMDQARLAIDALGALIDGLGERLGEAHPPLRDALAQIRIAYVQIGAAAESAPAGNGAPAPSGGEGAAERS